MNDHQDEYLVQGAPSWLRRVGTQSWLLIGFLLAAAVVFSLLSRFSLIITSLFVSLLLAILARPLVDWLEHRKIPRSLGTILTIILIFLGLVGLIVIMIEGIVQQSSEIAAQLQAGWINLLVWFSGYDVQLPAVNEIMTKFQDALPAIFEGVFGFLGSTFSTLLELFIGIYFSVFILFFLLRDIARVETWIARLISREHEVGETIVKDAGRTVQVYFRGTALTALITSVVVAIPLIVLKVPLIPAILLLYFITSFIPYIGAWIAGAFAVLIALGSGGIVTAWIILTAVIVSNGAIQTVVSSWALGSMLKLHPLVIFFVTIMAGMVGGFLLMILAVPLTAIVIQIRNHMLQARMAPE